MCKSQSRGRWRADGVRGAIVIRDYRNDDTRVRIYRGHGHRTAGLTHGIFIDVAGSCCDLRPAWNTPRQPREQQYNF